MDPLWHQIVTLFVLAIPIACVARTVVFEEVFREPREWCKRKSQTCNRLLQKKFFYLFTCEYCFSHWVTLGTLVLTRYRLLYDDWRGFVVAFFSLVFVANSYMNLYSRLRVDITSEKKAIEAKEKEIEVTQKVVEEKELQIQKLDAELTGQRPAPARQPRRSNGSGDGH